MESTHASISTARAGLALLVCGTLLIAVSTLHPGYATAGGGSSEMAAGVAWLDCDNDGDLDVLHLLPTGKIALMEYDSHRNTYVDVSSQALPEDLLSMPMVPEAISCGDLNNDGHVDFFLSMAGPNKVVMSNGDGTFRTPTGTGISGKALSASTAMFDYDNNGFLDIYVTNYMGVPNQFYRNDGPDALGNPQFTDVAPELGMDLALNGQSDWSLGVAVADYDNDGDPDLYVVNDFNGYNEFGGLRTGENILYRNEGDGTFTDVSFEAGVAEPGWAMGVDFGDYDGDGWLDIFVANFWEDALFHNNGDGTFTNVTREAGVITDAPDEWHYNSWGTSFIDIDNDGDLDLYVANGWITNGKGQVINEPNQLWQNQGTDYMGKVHFVNIAEEAGVDDVGNARGATYGDFNRDGLIDILVVNNGWVTGGDIVDRPDRLLYVNQGNGTFRDMGLAHGLRTTFDNGPILSGSGNYHSNKWMEVRLEGVQSNWSAMGSRVTIRAGGKTWIEDVGACSYASQTSPYLHFGLGDIDIIDELVARFPSGRTLTMEYIVPDQILHLIEPEKTPVSLLSFELASVREGVSIAWSYADPTGLDHFVVRRRTGDVESVVARVPTSSSTDLVVIDREAPQGVRSTYQLEAVYRDGNRSVLRSQSFEYMYTPATVLGQNFPNPFTAGTRIPISVESPGPVSVSIFNLNGRRVASLNETVAMGDHLLEWNGRDGRGRPVPAGTYFYQIQGSDRSSRMKMIVTR